MGKSAIWWLKGISSLHGDIFANQLECNDENKSDQQGGEKKEGFQLQKMGFQVDTWHVLVDFEIPLLSLSSLFFWVRGGDFSFTECIILIWESTFLYIFEGNKNFSRCRLQVIRFCLCAMILNSLLVSKMLIQYWMLYFSLFSISLLSILGFSGLNSKVISLSCSPVWIILYSYQLLAI